MSRAFRLVVAFACCTVTVAAQLQSWIIPPPTNVSAWEPDRTVAIPGRLTLDERVFVSQLVPLGDVLFGRACFML